MSAPAVLRVIVLGNRHAGDDGAALCATDGIEASAKGVELVRAGRPGAGLLELLDGAAAVVLVDVTRSGRAPGSLIQLPLQDLRAKLESMPPVSSHGFGPGEALRLGLALGRPLPRGRFVGIEGARFGAGEALTAEVTAALPALASHVREAIAELTTTAGEHTAEGARGCTRAG